MYDDPGDVDRNGIPDSIWPDPIVAPPEPEPLDSPAPDAGVPAIARPTDDGERRMDQDPALAHPPSAASKAAEAVDRYIRE